MKPVRTVLIDDAFDLRFLIAKALSASGRFDIVGQAADGREGIEVVEGCRPELVVLDLSMPVMDGLEALPRIRDVAPDATVVILSGHPDTLAADRAFEGGAVAYIEKGIAPTALVEVLIQAIGGEIETTVARPPVEPPETLAVVGQLAHDLRTPLASASGFIDLLRRATTAGTDQAEYAERAAAAVERLGRLLDSTIAYAREGHGSLDLRAVPLPAVLDAVRANLLTGAPQRRRLVIDVQNLAVKADELALERVVQNLVSNALTYSDDVVTVTARAQGDLVSLTVADQGPGIPEHDLAGLFQPFQRGDSGRQQGGTGLGLALAARLVSQMGGSISGRNREDGPGAIFEVELPLGSVPSPRDRRPDEAATRARA